MNLFRFFFFSIPPKQANSLENLYFCCDCCKGNLFFGIFVIFVQECILRERSACDKREEVKNEVISVFCLVRFCLDFRFALKRAKWPINFGITRYGWLITIIMWCHCRSASESNGHVFTITFFYWFCIFLSIHFGIFCSQSNRGYVCFGINWVGFVVAIWCRLVLIFTLDCLLYLTFLWSTKCKLHERKRPQVPIKKTRTNCY